MALENIFEKLLELPLFQGMSHNDLNQVVAHTKFGFLKIARNKAVVSEGDTCHHIYFLTSGSVKVESRADDGCYSFTEKMTAPDVIQPERLFGLTQRYTKSFTALEECSILRIDKQQVLRLIAEQEIFGSTCSTSSAPKASASVTSPGDSQQSPSDRRLCASWKAAVCAPQAPRPSTSGWKTWPG